MRKYVIERTVPGAGGMTNVRLAQLAGASGEELVRGHARLGGFPADSVRRVDATIDTTTAELIR